MESLARPPVLASPQALRNVCFRVLRHPVIRGPIAQSVTARSGNAISRHTRPATWPFFDKPSANERYNAMVIVLELKRQLTVVSSELSDTTQKPIFSERESIIYRRQSVDIIAV